MTHKAADFSSFSDCAWNDWSSWTPCSATCGKAFKSASRSVAQNATGGGDPCEGEKKRTQKCMMPACPTGKYDNLCINLTLNFLAFLWSGQN